MINFPDNIPSGLISSNSYNDKGVSTSISFSSGAPIVRRNDDNAWSKFSVSWNLSFVELGLFIDFYDSVKNGSLIFGIKLRDFDDYLGLYNVYFDSNYSVQASGKRYFVTSSLVGEFVERVYPPPLFVPPLPFTWSDTEKATDSFIEKLDAGTLRIKKFGSEQPLVVKTAITEPFDLMREYGGLIYFEFQCSNVSANYRDRLNFRLQSSPTLVEYEGDTNLFTDPQIIYENRKAAGFLPSELFVNLIKPDGFTPLDSERLYYEPTDHVSVALDFARAGNARLWIRTNGAEWREGGDPALGTTPSHTFGGGPAVWLDFPLYFTLSMNWYYSNAGEASLDFRIFGNDDHPFVYDVPAGFNGT